MDSMPLLLFFKPWRNHNEKVKAVFKVLNDAYPTPIAGSAICKKTGLRSGFVYPLLATMKEKSWTETVWEKIDPQKEVRPKRKLWRLTRSSWQNSHKILGKATMITTPDLIPSSLG